MPRIQLVGVLFEVQGLSVPRLICRVSLDGEVRDYYVYVDKRTAFTVDHLLRERPFRALRLDPSEGASLNYVGDVHFGRFLAGEGSQPAEGHPVLYLELCHGRSRRKYKITVPQEVVQQFHWLVGLSEHDPRQARQIIEA